MVKKLIIRTSLSEERIGLIRIAVIVECVIFFGETGSIIVFLLVIICEKSWRGLDYVNIFGADQLVLVLVLALLWPTVGFPPEKTNFFGTVCPVSIK